MRSFPLLLQAGERCATALGQAGKGHLGGALIAALGEMQANGKANAISRRCWRQAAYHWGHKACGSPGPPLAFPLHIALLRCCLP